MSDIVRGRQQLLADAPVLELETITDMEGLLHICSVKEFFRITIQTWIIASHNPWYLIKGKKIKEYVPKLAFDRGLLNYNKFTCSYRVLTIVDVRFIVMTCIEFEPALSELAILLAVQVGV